VEDEETVSVWGISEQVKYKNRSIVFLANKQVTGIGVNECPRQSPSRSKTKATTNDDH